MSNAVKDFDLAKLEKKFSGMVDQFMERNPEIQKEHEESFQRFLKLTENQK